MGLRLDQSSIGHSLNLLATFTPAHPTDRVDCKSKAMWLGWLPTPFTWSLASHRRWPVQATHQLLLAVLAGAISVDPWEIPVYWGST